MDEKQRKKIEERLEKMNNKEMESFVAFKNMFLEIASNFDPTARLLKAHSDCMDAIREVIDGICMEIPEDKRNDEKIDEFAMVLNQFIQICNDFKKENL